MITAEGLRLQLLRGGMGSLVVKLLSTVLAFSVGVVLARVLGPESYGVYTYAFTVVSVLAIPAEFGLPHLLVRETARAEAHQDWGLMRGIWTWTSTATGALSIVIALVAVGAVWVFGQNLAPVQLTTFAWALALIPLISLGKLRGAALRGLRHVVLGQLPESIIRPTLFVAAMLGLAYFWPNVDLAPDTAMMLHVLASACAFAAGAWMLWRARPSQLDQQVLPVYESRQWFSATLPLALLASMQLINKYTDILMLGLFRPAEDVGIYQIVVQGATLVVFGQQASNMVLAPQFARLYTLGDRKNLQRVIRLGALVGLITALPVAIAFLLFGEQILVLIFGSEYGAGYTALAILAVGQLVNAPLGQVAHLLNMTGHERATGRGFAVAALSNVLLNLLLIPPFGMSGAALATASTVILWNCVLWWNAFRLGVATNVI